MIHVVDSKEQLNQQKTFQPCGSLALRVFQKTVSEHIKSEQHKLAIKKQQQSELGADVYRESVIANSVIAKSFLPKLSPKDPAGLRKKVNTVYHLIKNEMA